MPPSAGPDRVDGRAAYSAAAGTADISRPPAHISVDSGKAAIGCTSRLLARMNTASQATAASTSTMPSSRWGEAVVSPGEAVTTMTPALASTMDRTMRVPGRSPSSRADSKADMAGSVPATMPASAALDRLTPWISSTV